MSIDIDTEVYIYKEYRQLKLETGTEYFKELQVDNRLFVELNWIYIYCRHIIPLLSFNVKVSENALFFHSL